MPVLPPYLLKGPAGIALLHLYPLRIWGPILEPKNDISPLSLQAPPSTKYLRYTPITVQYLLDSKQPTDTTVSFQSNRQLDS